MSTKNRPNKKVTNFLPFAVALGNCIFNFIVYSQIKSCEMGTVCALAYANIFTTYFEEKFKYPIPKAKFSSFS